MASYRKQLRGSKLWQAQRCRQGMTYSLGYYRTRQEAEQAEYEFDKDWPPRVRRTRLCRHCGKET